MLRFAATLALLVVSAATSSTAPAADIVLMWRQLRHHCDAGKCSLAEGSRLSGPANSTDCKGRLLAYEYGRQLLPARGLQLETFDALQLEATCGVARPAAAPAAAAAAAAAVRTQLAAALAAVPAARRVVVRPGADIEAALRALKQLPATGAPKALVFKAGFHELTRTIKAESGLLITADPAAAAGSVVVSGGVRLKPSWKKSARAK